MTSSPHPGTPAPGTPTPNPGTPATPDPGLGTPHAPHTTSPARSELARAAALAVGLTALLAGMLSLFAWPAARSAPHELPLVLAGPPSATAQLAGALAQVRPGAFTVTTVTTRDEAAAAIREQAAYGGIVVGPSGAEVLTASARSPVVAQLLGQLGSQLGSARGMPVSTTDLVGLPEQDPRGAGLVAGLLPIVLGGLALAAAATTLLRRRSSRLVAALTFSMVGGTTLAWLLHGWLGSIQGPFWPAAGVLSLAVAAVALAVLGLESVLGQAGLALGALLMMLLGNALSGAASAPELLPTGWGALGQWLPAGATNTALRSVAFFDGAGAGRPLLVLAGWAALGAVLLAVAPRGSRHTG